MIEVLTESGTTYQFREGADTVLVRRLADTRLTRDGQWLTMAGKTIPPFSVGEPMRLVLEPLGIPVGVTIRTTTPAVSIRWVEDDNA